jgi:acyl carrier protein
MDSKQRTDAILTFLREILHPDIQEDTALVEEGLLDSFAAVEVITFLEDEFGITIQPTDVKREDVANVRAMAALVERISAKEQENATAETS